MTIRLVSGRLAEVTGRVVDPHGRPLRGVPICYFGSQLQSRAGGAFSGADGRFALEGVDPTFRYIIRFGGWPQFGTEQDWPGYPPFAETFVPKQPDQQDDAGYRGGDLKLLPGETRDIGAVVVYPQDQMVRLKS
jgi:hypothetical protein